MIFSSELEVSQSDGYKSSDNDENDEDDEEDAVDGVDPVTPDTSENVVKLDVDGTERKETSHGHLRKSASVPRERRNLAGVFGCAAGCLELRFAVFTGDTT
uniref:Uncharacterized protein n=1 Tax=Noccaea caerulescens TaxID=107243 RepID=A0A1J3HN99_NOCCA